MQGGSLDAPENGGASSSSSPGHMVEPPGGLGLILTQTTRPNLKELSFAGNLMRASDSADAALANSKKLHGSTTLRGQDAAEHVSQQASVGLPPVAKDGTLGRVFSFPKMPEGEGNAKSLEANKDLMADMVRQQGQEGGDAFDEKLKTSKETFNDLLDRMSGSQMVSRAIQDITEYGEGYDDGGW